MYMQGLITPTIDAAIFADVGDEPQAVYRHVEWLKSIGGPPLMVRSKGRISDDLARGENSTGQRFASIPAFTAEVEGERSGMVQRQCSKEYKIEVIERTIRRELFGCEPGRPLASNQSVVQVIGISLDEASRADRIAANSTRAGWEVSFPLIERNMSRADCVRWLAENGNVPHEVTRSACVFCPYHSDSEWVKIKENPADWAHAVEVDARLRSEGVILNRSMDQKLYVHRSCHPLDQVEFKPEPERERALQLLMNWECVEGVCGV